MIPPTPVLVEKVLAPMALLLALVLAAAGCKQGIGDRCEQPSDCASGMCTAMTVMAGGGTGRCVEVGSSVTGAGGSTGAGGTGAAGSDGAAGDAQADGSEAGTDAEDAAPGGDAATDAVSTD
jgi:hypothetical protein